uniref:Microtubule-associated protein futsch n=1 Tax=Rhizophora mucronata TaxID=61149 RepID=A0A2P2NJM9_RHIMU
MKNLNSYEPYIFTPHEPTQAQTSFHIYTALKTAHKAHRNKPHKLKSRGAKLYKLALLALSLCWRVLLWMRGLAPGNGLLDLGN